VTWLGIALKREEAIALVKELLECCLGLDGHSLELSPPTLAAGGYQVIIRVALDEETKKCIYGILSKHQLAYQTGSIWRTKHSINKEPDTLIIYRPKK
jgi:hypothetical protein